MYGFVLIVVFMLNGEAEIYSAKFADPYACQGSVTALAESIHVRDNTQLLTAGCYALAPGVADTES